MERKSQKVQTKNGLIGLANRCAFGLMAGSVNSTCGWLHHQPKVPAEAKKYRKF